MEAEHCHATEMVLCPRTVNRAASGRVIRSARRRRWGGIPETCHVGSPKTSAMQVDMHLRHTYRDLMVSNENLFRFHLLNRLYPRAV